MSVHNFLTLLNATQKGWHLMAMVTMVLAAFFWAVIETLGGLIPKGYSPVQTVWSRYFVHLLFMLAVFGPRQRGALVRTNCIGRQVTRAMLMLVMPICFVFGTILLPLNVVWLVFWSSVLVQLLFAGLVLHENVSADLWIACVFGWAGLWLMTGAALPPLNWRLIPPLGMGFCYALYVVMTRRMRHESSHANLFHTALWVFLPLSPLLPLDWKMPTLRVIGIYLGIGLFGYVCLYFIDKTMEMVPAVLTAPFIFTVPLWSGVLEYFVHHKVPVALTWLGAIIVAAASAYVVVVESFGRRRLVSSSLRGTDRSCLA
jgi:drug/metabolite transporter (DMT)-like permease